MTPDEKIRQMKIARIKEGMARAKAEGRPISRGESPLPENFKVYYNLMRRGIMLKNTAAKELGISRSTLYRWIRKYERDRF